MITKTFHLHCAMFTETVPREPKDGGPEPITIQATSEIHSSGPRSVKLDIPQRNIRLIFTNGDTNTGFDYGEDHIDVVKAVLAVLGAALAHNQGAPNVCVK